MKKMSMMMLALALTFVLTPVHPVLAMEGMEDGSKAMDEESGHGSAMKMGFSTAETVEGVRAEIQVMKLSDMNITDPDGKTHHVMINFFNADNGEKYDKVVGKAKLIAPSKKEQVADLKDFSGTYAANFDINEPGEWGVICLFVIDDQKRMVKFWYPNHE